MCIAVSVAPRGVGIHIVVACGWAGHAICTATARPARLRPGIDPFRAPTARAAREVAVNALTLALLVGLAAPTARLFDNDGGAWHLVAGLGGTFMLEDPDEESGHGGFGVEADLLRVYDEYSAWLGLYADGRFGDGSAVGGLGLRIGALLFAIDNGPIVSGEGFGWRVRGALDLGWISIFRGAEIIAGRTDQSWGFMLKLPWVREDGEWWLFGKPARRPPSVPKRRPR